MKPTPEEEIRELRRMAVDFQKRFDQLWAKCNARGLSVGYDDDGQVTIKDEKEGKQWTVRFKLKIPTGI